MQMGFYNQDFLDAIALVSFLVGIANYEENLTQSDKDDLIQKLDKQTKEILDRIEPDLEKQNEMLKKILERLGDKK